METFADLSVCTLFQPGTSADPSRLDADLIVPVLGDKGQSLRNNLRRLWLEASAMSAEAIRQRCAVRDDDAPVRLPAAEREARRAQLAERLKGIVELEGEFDPGHQGINKVYDMVARDTVMSIPWGHFVTRAQELSGVTYDKHFRTDSQGYMKETVEPRAGHARMDDDYTLRNTLTRRAICFDIAGVASFETMEAWHRLLFKEYMRPPPAGRAPLTSSQLLQADTELFERAASRCRNGVRRQPDGLPFDNAVTELQMSHSFSLLLLPRETSSGAGMAVPHPSPGGKRKAEPGDANQAELKRLRQQLQASQAANKKLRAAAGAAASAPRPQQTPPDPNSKRQQKLKAKGRGKGANGRGKSDPARPPFVPARLRGFNPRTADGRPICFGFNLDGCDQAQPGGQCPKGVQEKMQPL